MRNSIRYFTDKRLGAFIFVVALTGYLASPFLRTADASPPPLPAPPVLEDAKLLASDGAAGDRFGFSVSISGDTAVLGAFGDDGNQGSAYILKKNEGGPDNWGEVAKLTASDGAADDNFGFSASISGDTVIVSAVSDDDNGTNSGSAYIFERNAGGANNWGQVAKITASDGAGGDNFGYSASTSGDTVIVGAYLDDGGRGSAYIFEKNQGGANNWGEVTKLVAADGVGGDQFGFSASISGDTAVVSAWLDDNGNGTNAGSGYIFQRNEGGANNWGEVTKLTTSDGSFDDRLGYSAAISSDNIVIGAYRDDPFGSESGSAYIFERNEGGPNNWGEVTKLIASDGSAGDQFGFGVAVLSDTILIGARRDDNEGAAYVYKRNEGGANNWGETSKLVASDAIPGAGNAGPNFGVSVTLSSDTAIVSSFTNDEIGTDAGAVYVFGITPPNSAPTIASGSPGTAQGSPSSNQLIATVMDGEDDDDSLSVTINGGASATMNGVTVSNLAIAPNGDVSADVVAADCTASDADFSLNVADSGGLTAIANLSVSVSAETTPPVIDPISDVVAILAPGSTATSAVVSFPNPTATDNCGAPVVTASPVSGSLFPIGETTVTVDAVDDAGNNADPVTFTVRVLYNFAGFFSPIDNMELNNVKAGRGIPIKFSLSGDKGLNIIAAGYPASYSIPCGGAGEDGEEIPTVTAGNSSLSYDAVEDQYNYVWKTDKGWKNTCRRLVVQLNDGSIHTADFKFK